jgi:hypothetical protein
MRGDREAAAYAILALLDPQGDEETRYQGALLIAEALRDLFLIRSALIKVRGED